MSKSSGRQHDPSVPLSERLKKEKVKKVSIGKLIDYASKADRIYLLVGSIFAVVTGLCSPALSIILGTVMSDYTEASAMIYNATTPEDKQTAYDFLHDRAISSVINYCIVGTVSFFSAAVQVWLFMLVGERITDRMRRHYLCTAMRQDIGWYDQSEAGIISSKLFGPLDRVREGTGDKVAMAIQYLTQFIGSLAVAFWFEWRLSLITISIAPVIIISGLLIAKFSASVTSKESHRHAVANGIAEEVLTSVKTVHAFNGQEYETDRYANALQSASKYAIRKSVCVGANMALHNTIVSLAWFIAFWMGTNYVSEGSSQPNDVFTAFMEVMFATIAVGQLGPIFSSIGSAFGAAGQLMQVIDRVPDIDSFSDEGIVPKETIGRVEFKDVHFSYPNRTDVQILNGISFEAAPGKTIALVGSSGCGKSTTISLLLRYYDPTQGKILLDGVDISDLQLSNLRRTIAVVSQEPILFDTTIEENIRFGNDNVTDEEIVHALTMANAYEFVSRLKMGLNTVVGTNGTQLSGGQKQRIAIARALVRNPKILLLDEATSALDTKSEKIVQQALENASRGRTTIVIAHRLSTIRDAHQIIVMQHGQIVERGTHNELLSNKGHYYDLVNSQVFVDDEKCVSGTDLSTRTNSSEQVEDIKGIKGGNIEKDKGDIARLKKELAEEGVSRASMFRIMRQADHEGIHLFFGLIASILTGLAYPAFSIIVTNMMRVFALSDTSEQLSQGHLYSSFFLVLGAMELIASFFACSLFGWAAERITRRLRVNVFSKILSMQISYMEEPKHSPGRICTRLASDASLVKSAIDHRLAQASASIISILTGIGISLYFAWQMTLSLMIIFPVSSIGQTIMSKYAKHRAARDKSEMEKAGKIATEAIENIRTVQALTLEESVKNRFDSHLDESMKTTTTKALIQGISYGLSTCIFYFANSLAVLVSIFLITRDYVPPLDLITSALAISMSAINVNDLSSYAPEYIKASFAAGLIFDMLGMTTDIDGVNETEGEIGVLEGTLALRRVKYAYEQRKDELILDGFDLEVKAGQTVALVGPSGCGKSTVVGLLERFYEPTQGDVMIDGVSLASRNLHNVRSQMSIVNQEPILFDMSIRDNISYGLDIDERTLIRAATSANAHNFIVDLPMGYDTRVGSKGTQLSGGQKQRIAIARALVRNPKILLLDEATSALDMESEKIVQEALDAVRSGRTCILIAHRLSTVVGADKIVVVKDGKVLEQGTHAELLDKKGAYYSMTLAQSNSH